MSDKYRIYWYTPINKSETENAWLLAFNGCNGERHLLKIVKEFCDETGEVESEFLVTNIDLGKCDKDCGSDEDLGEFEEKGQIISIARPGRP